MQKKYIGEALKRGVGGELAGWNLRPMVVYFIKIDDGSRELLGSVAQMRRRLIEHITRRNDELPYETVEDKGRR